MLAQGDVREGLAHLKKHTQLPTTVGFGIRTPEQAAEVARAAEGVVVGTAIVNRVFESVQVGRKSAELVDSASKRILGNHSLQPVTYRF